MGIIARLSPKKSEPTITPEPAQTVFKADGRGRLRAVTAELAKATECVSELEVRSARLTSIIADADAAQAALQEAIAEDGGVSLEAYGAGRASDDPIAELVGAKENTAKAASAARDALPRVQDMLTKARAEVSRLEALKFDAMIVYLKTRAGDEHKSFVEGFNQLSASYDALCGIAVALAATGHSDMMTTALPIPIRAPGFNMNIGPAHGPSEQVIMTHGVAEAKIAHFTARWMQARERLMQDVDADLEDLIGAAEPR